MKLTKRQGSNNVNARLTDAKVKTIRKEWPEKSQTFLAKKFRVNPTTIHRLVSGFTWRHCL